jgi:hypothetical protein
MYSAMFSGGQLQLFGLKLAFAAAYLAPTLNPVDMLGQNGEVRVRRQERTPCRRQRSRLF